MSVRYCYQFCFKNINTITMNVNLTLILRLLSGTLNVSQDKINKIIYRLYYYLSCYMFEKKVKIKKNLNKETKNK